ncbi:hypothetical protein Pcinc_042286 [Petrolisthes cinctipes]|uniref:Uncharacterized protein n=1 Tax=Petrolisthes cinctipes TaxID=88211 RepID=A0AAE1EG49_PETCI|nr:hypothetical protein Pcinc_042286 [Petrolisthes cinctipes]
MERKEMEGRGGTKRTGEEERVSGMEGGKRRGDRYGVKDKLGGKRLKKEGRRTDGYAGEGKKNTCTSLTRAVSSLYYSPHNFS